MEFVIYSQLITHGICDSFVINYQLHVQFFIYLQSIINSDGICNLFVINYQF